MLNSFTLTAIGQVGNEPETGGEGDRSWTKFSLIGNDRISDEKEYVTTVYFIAFNGTGEAIAKHVRKGDQLIIEAQMRSNNWIDNSDRKHYDYSYIVQGFKFGAPGKIKRAELAAARRDSEPAPDVAAEGRKGNGKGRSRSTKTDTATAAGAPPF